MRLPLLLAVVAGIFPVSTPPVGTWVELGPRSSGRVSAIAAADVEHMWAASPGGGVWKTTDGGSHWIWAGNYGLGDFTALDLELDRNDPNRLYLRTWNGFLVSVDGAAHWKQTLNGQGPNGDTSHHQPSMTCGVFPACPPYASVTDFEPRAFTQMVFSARQSILLTALPCGGLQYSTDSGNSFKQLWPFPGAHPETNPDNCIISIAADEATGKVYFSSMGGSTHIFRSTAPWTAAGPPAAIHWELANHGMAGNQPASSIVWGGSANRLMAVVTDWSVQPSHATAYLFNGTTWTPKPFNNARCIMSDARPLVWGGGNDFFVGGVTFGYTANAGDSWVCPDLNQQYVDIRAIHADRKLRQVWIGADQSALESHFVISRYPWTPGASISPATGSDGVGISSWQTYSVAAPPSSEHRDRIIVGAQDVAAACTDDDGAHWRLLPTDESQSLIWRKNGSGDVVYSYSTLGTLQRSTNAGSAAGCANITFSSASPPDSLRETKGFVGPRTMAVHPLDANRVYLASGRSILYSANGGAHWSRAPFSVSGGTKTNPPSATSIFVDEAGVIYVGTLDGGAFICTDAAHLCDGSAGAGKWQPWGLNSGSPRMITAIAESNAPPAPRTFWMATSQGLYRKLPPAGAWTFVGTTPGYVYSDVIIDPTCHSRIYAALGYLDPISRSRGGIQFSSNNGATWTSLTAGAPLHNVPITQVILTPETPGRVLASTYGRGSWEYDWGPQLPPCGK